MSNQATTAPVATPGADRPVENPPVPAPSTTAAPAQKPTTNVGAPPPPAHPVPFAPRGQLRRPPRDTAPGVSTMLDMVSFAPWSRDENLSLSTYVPDSSALFVTLAECDNLMLSTDRFTRGHPQWHPFVSRLYMAMIHYFRIMDCMVFAGIADSEIITLLARLKSQYDFRRLPIPGPLVPHIQALSVASSGHEILGDVTPHLPLLSTTTAKQGFTLNQAYSPNPLALMDYLQNIAESTATNRSEEEPTAVNNLFRADITDTPIPGVQYTLSTAGFGARTLRVRSELDTFVSARSRLSLPPRINIADLVAVRAAQNWYQFLRFRPVAGEPAHADFANWFGRVSAVMSDYASYFRDSTTLGTIAIAAGGSPHVLATYVKPTDTRLPPVRPATHTVKTETVPAHYKLPMVNTLASTAEVRVLGLPDLYKQLGILSLTNARRASSPTEERNGDAWTQVPVIDKMSEFNTYRNIPTYVSTLHVSRALE